MKAPSIVAVAAVALAAGCAPDAGGPARENGPVGIAVADAVTPKEKTDLFNGTDLDGWVGWTLGGKADPMTVWTVADGAIRCKGAPFSYLRTETAYTNYRLHVEWRWPAAPTNSGVLLHMSGEQRIWPTSFEAQLSHTNAGDLWRIGNVGCTLHGKPITTTIRIPKRGPASERPAGQWNAYDIDCSGSTLRLTVNGTVQNEVTAVAPAAGYIGFQCEGSPIEFRNIYIEPGTENPAPEAGASGDPHPG